MHKKDCYSLCILTKVTKIGKIHLDFCKEHA